MIFTDLVFFDTEFVCSKSGYYPIQICFESKKCQNNEFLDKNCLNSYIKPKNSKILTKYFIRYTGITYDFLSQNGEKYNKEKKRVINYFKSFDLSKTIFIGWDIYNDLEVFKQLTKSLRFRFSKVNFLDFSELYMNLKNNVNHTKLSRACEDYKLESKSWHNAAIDTSMTFKLFEKIANEIGIEKIIRNNVYNYKK